MTRDHEAMVQSIIAHYNRTDDCGKRRGRAWYRKTAAIMAGYNRHGHTAQVAAAVFASYSVNTPWTLNLRYARKHLRGIVPSTLGQNIRRAENVMAGMSMDEAVKDKSALKIRNFACNLAGCMECVTVDRWAMLVATGEKYVPKGAEYNAVAAAYRDAAARLGEYPADVQAITWLLVRED